MGTAQGDREDPVARDVSQRGKGEVILVVEDEMSLSIMLQELISSLGYQVEVARTATDALNLFDRCADFDLVLTDIVMPGGMDGFELARAIRQRNADIPLIYMSGYTGYSDQDMGDVIAPMLAKPCPPSELASAIRTALGQD